MFKIVDVFHTTQLKPLTWVNFIDLRIWSRWGVSKDEEMRSHQSGFHSAFGGSSSYSLWKLSLQLALIGALVRNLSRGAENWKDVDTSHPQSKAVSTGRAEIKEEAGDQLLPRRRRVAPVHWIHRQCDSLGMEIQSVSRTWSYCKNRGNTGHSEWCGCILRGSKGYRRPVLMYVFVSLCC